MENYIAQNEFGYTLDGKVFKRSLNDEPDRIIGEVRESDQAALNYFINRFNLAVEKVGKLETQITEAQNKGSFLTKLIQLRSSLVSYDGLGNFQPLFVRLDNLQDYLEDLIFNNQVKNLEIKNALIEDLKNATEHVYDWKQTTLAVQEIKTKWLKTGPIDKFKEVEIETKFNDISDDFFIKRREYFLDKNVEIDAQIAKAEELTDKTFRLRYSEDIDQAYETIKLYQAEFKTFNELPPKKKKFLWRNFKKANDMFFEQYNKVKGIVQKPRIDIYQQALTDLCTKAEALVNVPPDQYVAASNSAKQFLVDWKTNAPKVKYIDKNLAENFRNACDKIFEMNYLVRVIGYRHPEFSDKPRIEQLKIMINQMDYLVRKELAELEVAIHNNESMRANPEIDRQNMLKINTQKRKIAMKDILLANFKTELEDILS